MPVANEFVSIINEEVANFSRTNLPSIENIRILLLTDLLLWNKNRTFSLKGLGKTVMFSSTFSIVCIPVEI